MHTLVCLVRADHPEVKSSRISMSRFLRLSHAVVTPMGRSGELFETMLKEKGLQRRVQLTSVHFLTVPAIIATTDMIVTVPRSIADYYTRLENLRMVEPPLNIKPYAVKQFWHPRFNADPAIRWLRESVVRLFGTQSNAVRPPKKAPSSAGSAFRQKRLFGCWRRPPSGTYVRVDAEEHGALTAR